MIHDDNPSTGGWYSWQDRPQEYKQAFRYVYNIFKEEGAQNVKFVWSPNYIPSELAILEKYYPGDEYVDWIGIDGYNWGNQSFDDIFYTIYQNIVQNKNIFGDKKIMLGEFASAQGSLKGEWIEDAFKKIKEKYPKIEAFYWFNIDKERDWRVNSSPESLAAFRRAMSDYYFTSHPSQGENKGGNPVNPQNIRVSVVIPKISIFNINVVKIEGKDWNSDSQMDFGTLQYDSQYGIFRGSWYYVIDVGVISNESDWNLTHTSTPITNGIDTLDDNINVVFTKQSNTEAVELGKYSFKNSNGISYSKNSLKDGWLRIYYGLATGSNDALGVEPVTLAKAAGRYQGTVTIIFTVK